MPHAPETHGARGRRYGGWIVASVLGALSLYPSLAGRLAARRAARRLDAIEARLGRGEDLGARLDPLVSLRVERLGPLLASWETLGGCGAGSSRRARGVKLDAPGAPRGGLLSEHLRKL